jgi:uncharacterized membrane protein YhaH (DUF805 family)
VWCLLFAGALAWLVSEIVTHEKGALLVGGVGLVLITGNGLRMAVKRWRDLGTERSSDSADRDAAPDQK